MRACIVDKAALLEQGRGFVGRREAAHLLARKEGAERKLERLELLLMGKQEVAQPVAQAGRHALIGIQIEEPGILRLFGREVASRVEVGDEKAMDDNVRIAEGDLDRLIL